MKEQLSLADAKRLSIIKWEVIVQNNGEIYGCKYPQEVAELNCYCGFCERWRFPSEDSCKQCELALAMGMKCTSEDSPYSDWHKVYTKETALVVLDIIKNL